MRSDLGKNSVASGDETRILGPIVIMVRRMLTVLDDIVCEARADPLQIARRHSITQLVTTYLLASISLPSVASVMTLPL